MKIKFLSECKDKNTGVKYKIGDELVFPVDRAKEILSTGYAIEIKEEKTDETKDEFERMTVSKLRDFAKFKGIDTKKAKNKTELIESIFNSID